MDLHRPDHFGPPASDQVHQGLFETAEELEPEEEAHLPAGTEGSMDDHDNMDMDGQAGSDGGTEAAASEVINAAIDEQATEPPNKDLDDNEDSILLPSSVSAAIRLAKGVLTSRKRKADKSKVQQSARPADSSQDEAEAEAELSDAELRDAELPHPSTLPVRCL